MNFSASDNCKEVGAALKKTGANAPKVVAKGTGDGLAVLLDGSRAMMKRLIYERSIPKESRRRRTGGRLGGRRLVALWKRSGALLRGEYSRVVKRADTVTGEIDNTQPYAAARHADKERPAQWRTEALKKYQTGARDAFMKDLAALTP
ncbi:hypothetical protein EON83_00085 [bacterium]|nr:MAG: hypothetical protein EON83_00085 [bacterium]